MKFMYRVIAAFVIACMFTLLLPLMGHSVPDGYGAIVAISNFVTWYYFLGFAFPERTKR